MRTQLTRLSLLALSAPLLHAQTSVGGVITTDTTWTVAAGPYQLTATVTVTGGATLRIDPGVEVQLSSGQSILVGDAIGGPGALIARGSELQPIRFTSTTAAPGSWDSIRFANQAVDTQLDASGAYLSGSALERCIVEFGGPGGGAGVVETDFCSLLITQWRSGRIGGRPCASSRWAARCTGFDWSVAASPRGSPPSGSPGGRAIS